MEILKHIHLSRREKVILIVTLLVIATSAGYSFIIEPVVSNYSGIRNKIGYYQKQLIRARAIIAHKERIEKEYEQYAGFITSKIDAAGDEDYFFTEIESIARQANFKVNQIRPLPDRQVEFYRLNSVEVDGSSTMLELSKFIYNLQTSTQLYKVTSLKIRPESRPSDRLKSTLLITTLTLPD